ncbi:cupin domain-containing protein [Maledivibacter halophilus]|uniref:ChrR Cupin-like domain-containing protein n=1 Tax=Maledivibacter halophilus TaxID=36842 RepID=A0A1T5L3H6_9FIRM|nr:cupin domain-containing protein [Maledivibacter halophilus]SKC70567.1 ChrR Cupin-like domain-containing protein [Maledivibacter halophilus]
MAKPELEFFDVDLKVPWKQVEDAQEGIMEKIVSRDPETGSYTRILKFPPMETDQVLVHDFWEEVYIIDGSLYDKNKKETYLKGYYACRPPGMVHGPYKIPNGCMTMEIRTFEK